MGNSQLSFSKVLALALLTGLLWASGMFHWTQQQKIAELEGVITAQSVQAQGASAFRKRAVAVNHHSMNTIKNLSMALEKCQRERFRSASASDETSHASPAEARSGSDSS